MRLAFCLYEYYPYGGLQRDFLRIAKACAARGHEIHIFTMKWNGEFPDRFILHKLPVKGFSNHGKIRNFVKLLRREFSSYSFDLVIGFNKIPGVDLYFAADKSTLHKLIQDGKKWKILLPRYRTYVNLEKELYKKGAHTQIMLLNPQDQNVFESLYQTEPERFYLLPPGVDKSRQRPKNQEESRKDLREEMGVAENEFVLLMVGSDFKRKGVDRALKAFSLIDQKAQFWIVGAGNPRKMKALAKELGISDRVHFLGARDDVVALYAAADLLLHPAKEETAGIVLIEAIVAGLPILVTRNSGYSCYVEQAGAGAVVEGGEGLEEKLRSLLDDATLQRCRERALDYGENHDLFGLADRAVEIVESLGGRSSSSKKACGPSVLEFKSARYSINIQNLSAKE